MRSCSVVSALPDSFFAVITTVKFAEFVGVPERMPVVVSNTSPVKAVIFVGVMVYEAMVSPIFVGAGVEKTCCFATVNTEVGREMFGGRITVRAFAIELADEVPVEEVVAVVEVVSVVAVESEAPGVSIVIVAVFEVVAFDAEMVYIVGVVAKVGVPLIDPVIVSNTNPVGKAGVIV